MSSLLPVLQILEHMQGGRRVNRRYTRRSEDTEQMSVMDWARWNQNAHPELELLHHCPNGGSRNKAEAVKLKQMGVKAGIPDLCLPVPMGVYSGLYIEMKYDTGRQPEENAEGTGGSRTLLHSLLWGRRSDPGATRIYQPKEN